MRAPSWAWNAHVVIAVIRLKRALSRGENPLACAAKAEAARTGNSASNLSISISSDILRSRGASLCLVSARVFLCPTKPSQCRSLLGRARSPSCFTLIHSIGAFGTAQAHPHRDRIQRKGRPLRSRTKLSAVHRSVVSPKTHHAMVTPLRLFTSWRKLPTQLHVVTALTHREWTSRAEFCFASRDTVFSSNLRLLSRFKRRINPWHTPCSTGVG
jgi:hypothetical protein